MSAPAQFNFLQKFLPATLHVIDMNIPRYFYGSRIYHLYKDPGFIPFLLFHTRNIIR